MTRRGFTLLEVIVSMALMTIVLAGAWLMFSFSDRSRGVTATARALQTAMLIEETLTNDLARLVKNGGAFRFDPDHTNWITFTVVDPRHQTPDGTIGVRAVRYLLDPASSLLKRKYGDANDSIGTSPLVSIEFLPFRSLTGTLLRVNLTVGRTKDDPEGPPFFHTFLARPALTASAQNLKVESLSDVPDAPEAKNKGVPPPIPDGVFPPAQR